MAQSMTGFGAVTGENQTHSWAAELRSVNGKGLDIKIRVPDWIDGLETAVRARLKQLIKRGNVTLTIKLHSDENDQDRSLSIDQDILIKTLNNITKIEQIWNGSWRIICPVESRRPFDAKGHYGQQNFV